MKVSTDLRGQPVAVAEFFVSPTISRRVIVHHFVDSDEWVQVSAHPEVLDLILRLHIRIGLCHQRLGDEFESVMTFEDAYKIVKVNKPENRGSRANDYVSRNQPTNAFVVVMLKYRRHPRFLE